MYAAYAANAANQYQEMQVQSTPGKMVVMLYDGALRFLHLGLDGLRRRDLVAQGTNLGKAQNILLHLNGTLDLSAGPISQQLRSIYRYCLERLLRANAEDRADYVEEVIRLLTPLRDAWEQAERQVGAERTEEAPVLAGAAA